MNYIPGTAKFGLKKSNSKNKNLYVINVECDANDGDYIKETLSVDVKDITEKDILLIAYLNLNHDTIPSNWEDAKNAYDEDCNYPFGGVYVADNDRFGYNDEELWLADYALDNTYLLYCGAFDGCCHSVESIEIIYFDNDGVKYNCTDVNLGDLFDSEHEFIDYVTKL